MMGLCEVFFEEGPSFAGGQAMSPVAASFMEEAGGEEDGKGIRDNLSRHVRAAAGIGEIHSILDLEK